jgi:solute carrier family 25 phosphate transporter 23/24/25/41
MFPSRPWRRRSSQLTIHFQPLAPDLTALERIRQTFAQPVLASFVAGGVAGAVSRTVVSPLERLKILFQIQSVGREEYKMSVPKALAKMWREEGWRGFMAGNGTNCIRIVPYSAVQFSAYNVYKRVSDSFSALQ